MCPVWLNHMAKTTVHPSSGPRALFVSSQYGPTEEMQTTKHQSEWRGARS